MTAKTQRQVLHAYLLGTVPFENAAALQRRLLFQVTGDRDSGAIILCEHSSIITVGRHGSRAHILCDPAELVARQWIVRWVNRGGGCVLHIPGQLSIYSIVPLDAETHAVPSYVVRLSKVLVQVMRDFDLKAEVHGERGGVWIGDRCVAVVGIGVRNWVTYYGAVLNINPDLECFRRVRVTGNANAMMTSLERERRGPVKSSLVRERLLEHFAAEFGFDRTSLFHESPTSSQKARSDAVATRG